MAEQQPPTKAMTLRLPECLHEEIRREAFERRIPMARIVIDALERRKAPLSRGCDVCGQPHVVVSTPGGFRFCSKHRPEGS